MVQYSAAQELTPYMEEGPKRKVSSVQCSIVQ